MTSPRVRAPINRWRDAIARSAELTLADRVVGMVLSSQMTHAGEARIGMAFLCEHAQLSERAVRRARRKMLELRLLSWKSGAGGRGSVARYRALIDGIRLPIVPDTLPGFADANPGNGDTKPRPHCRGTGIGPVKTVESDETPADPTAVKELLGDLINLTGAPRKTAKRDEQRAS